MQVCLIYFLDYSIGSKPIKHSAYKLYCMFVVLIKNIGRNFDECPDAQLVFADLKAFERRLTEYVSCLQPATGRWRSKYLQFQLCLTIISNISRVNGSQPEYFEFYCKGFRPTLFCHLFSGDIHQYLTFVSVILIVVSVCTATGAWNWLIDPDTQKVSVYVIKQDTFHKDQCV